MRQLLTYVATLGPVGYFPIAPGTIGSLVALAFVYFFPMPDSIHAIIILSVFLAGSLSANIAEKTFGQKDCSRIVIDEFLGILVASYLLPHSLLFLGGGFVLFRFFDITKPLMIRSLESLLPGGLGVMADDVLAGLYANIILQAICYLAGLR